MLGFFLLFPISLSQATRKRENADGLVFMLIQLDARNTCFKKIHTEISTAEENYQKGMSICIC